MGLNFFSKIFVIPLNWFLAETLRYMLFRGRLFHHYHERTKHSYGGKGLRPGVRFLEYENDDLFLKFELAALCKNA
jgi:hypothetical protein